MSSKEERSSAARYSYKNRYKRRSKDSEAAVKDINDLINYNTMPDYKLYPSNPLFTRADMIRKYKELVREVLNIEQ